MRNGTDDEGLGGRGGRDGLGAAVAEVHGVHVPAYSKELAGSPGVRQHQLPTNHDQN